jgi:type II secretory pathway predicted ATPase ExeA
MNKLLSTFGLMREPFSKDISAADMFQTEQWQESLQSLKATVEGRSSAVVTGDSGSGKTCLLRALEEDLPQGATGFITHATLPSTAVIFTASFP